MFFIFTFVGLLLIGFSACQQQPKPEEKETPTMEEALKEQAPADPNDFTVNPLAGSVISLDDAVAGSTEPLNIDVAAKNAQLGALILFSANGTNYVVINKADNKYAGKALAEMAGKKVNLFGLVKPVNGVNFFIMEKMEEAK